MNLSFINTTTDVVNITFNNGINRLINPCESYVISIDSDLISFMISSLKESRYGTFKRTELLVLSNYKLKNTMQSIQFHIIKKEAEDSALNKYIGWFVSEEWFFDEIEYSINNEYLIGKTERKNNILAHLISIFSNIFSAINIIFIAIGFAVGVEFGVKNGIICYLIVLGLYSIILEIVGEYQDRKKSIVYCMTDESIKSVFQSSSQKHFR